MIEPRKSPLLTDLYQLTMLQAYFAQGMNDIAVFEFFAQIGRASCRERV